MVKSGFVTLMRKDSSDYHGTVADASIGKLSEATRPTNDVAFDPVVSAPDRQQCMVDALRRYTRFAAALSQISARDIEDHLLIR